MFLGYKIKKEYLTILNDNLDDRKMTADPKIKRERQAMLAAMRPTLTNETYYFCTTNDLVIIAEILNRSLAVFREDEGTTLVLTKDDASQHGFDLSMPMGRIILEVLSALDGIGLTAGVATALADKGIPCNVIAAYHHDNIFVPDHLGQQAIDILLDVQQKAITAGG